MGDNRTRESIFDRASSSQEEGDSRFHRTLCCCVLGSGGDPIFEIFRNVTAVLGQDVDLTCVYRGDGKIIDAEWRRRVSSTVRSKGLAGFKNGIPYSRNGFSEPVSMTNLTVRMKVLGVEAEGEYICKFESEEEEYSNSVFLRVLGELTFRCSTMAPKHAWILNFVRHC